MIQIGICDDNLNLQQKYQRMIDEIMQQAHLAYDIKVFDDGRQVIQYLEQKENILHILFLDILMKDMGGIETAKKLREKNENILITFLTSSEEYLFETMDVKPQAYLMKDQLTKENLANTLLKEVEIVQTREKEKTELEEILGTDQFSFDDISYISIALDSCSVHQRDGSVFKHNNRKILDDLKGKNFFQIHPQYIVGLRYIHRIEKKQVQLSDKEHSCLPIDESYVKELKHEFTEFMMRQL